MSNVSYRLFISARSPFARRARLAMLRLGVPFDAEVLDVFQPTEPFLKANPLGLVPVLMNANGQSLPDSSSILEYLNEAHGGKIWPTDPLQRYRIRRLCTFSEGLMEATVQQFLESRKKSPSSEFIDEQFETMERTFGYLGRELAHNSFWDVGKHPGQLLNQAGWDLGVALEYLDMRCPQLGWRKHAPGLEKVLEICRLSQDFNHTTPPPPAA